MMTIVEEAEDKIIEGRQLLHAGVYEKAIDRLTGAMQLHFDYCFGSESPSGSEVKKSHQLFTQAEQLLKEAVEKDPTNTTANTNLYRSRADGSMTNRYSQLMVIGWYAFLFILVPVFFYFVLLIVLEPEGKLVALMPGTMGMLFALFIPNAILNAMHNPVYIRGTVTGRRINAESQTNSTEYKLRVDGRKFPADWDWGRSRIENIWNREFLVPEHIYSTFKNGDHIVMRCWRGPFPGQERVISIGRDYPQKATGG